MSTVAGELELHGVVGVTEADVAQVFGERLSATRRGATQPLSASERDFLAAHAGVDLPPHAGGSDRERVEKAAGAVADAVAMTWSVREAAEHLGIDRSNVARRIQRGSLWAIEFAGHHRLARWQFVAGDGVLPGLREVIAAIPRGYPLDVVDARMRSEFEELGGRTIIDYLAAGGSPEIAAGLVDELDRW